MVDTFQTPCSLDIHEAGGQLALSEIGIVLSLVFDELGNPVIAVAEISHDAEIQHIGLLCWVFRDMGWEV